MSRKRPIIPAPHREPDPQPARGPLMIDRYLAQAAVEDTHMFAAMPQLHANKFRNEMRSARVFVLDDNAIDRFAAVVRDIPEYIAKHQAFARPPYDSMWIEFDFCRFYESVTGREPDETADVRLAYFIINGTAFVFASGKGNSRVVAMPIVYQLHEPWPLESQIQLVEDCGTSRMQVLAFLWGESVMSTPPETLRELRDAHTVVLGPTLFRDALSPEKYKQAMHRLWDTVCLKSSGDLRNIVALLLLLNRPNLTTFVRDVPRRRGFVGNKLVPYLSHTVATIALDPKPAIISIGTPEDEHTPRRRHEVRGHYCHNNAYKEATARGCEHDMVRDEESTHPDDSWKCRICNGKRWWKPKFERGDASKGFVIKQYNVTAHGESS